MSINLKNLAVCENIIVSFDGKVSIINMFTEVMANSFPAINPKFTVLVSVDGDIGEYSETVEIVDPNDKVIISSTGKVEIKGAGGNNFVANFINTQFPIEGKYWIKVSINGKVLTNKINHFISVKKV